MDEAVLKEYERPYESFSTFRDCYDDEQIFQVNTDA